jgi:hypothetical protein
MMSEVERRRENAEHSDLANGVAIVPPPVAHAIIAIVRGFVRSRLIFFGCRRWIGSRLANLGASSVCAGEWMVVDCSTFLLPFDSFQKLR